MKRIFKTLSIFISILLLASLLLSGCRPKAKAPPSAADQLGIDEGISVIASPIATINIPPWLVRYRIRYIPPGWFLLGSDPEEDDKSRGDEQPQRTIGGPGFWIGESEVTNKEFEACVKSGACTPPSLRDSGPTNHFGDPAFYEHPVVGVNWFQAVEYCEWVDGRLPTEAEWELAARGFTGFIYPWGDEDPTCDRTNMNGCTKGDTKPVGSYPLGISPLGLFDMAGNVREWTFDNYLEDAYQTLALFRPSNSADSGKKVARGGGFNDFDENLRTTARLALDPSQDFDDVGFRCIPVTRSYAPMCEPTYIPLCYDPDEPTPDEPCEPEENVPTQEGGPTFLGYGCPMNGQVSFQVNTGGATGGFSGSVNGEPFNCQPSATAADVLDCTGPETPMGTSVQVVVCSSGATQLANVGEPVKQASDILPVSFITSGKVSLMMATNTNCPEGYIFDEKTGACIRDETEPECPDNWTFDPKNQLCVPNDPEEDCPETTTFSANLQGCQPEDGDCPEGYFLTANKVCEPDENRQDDCPRGYYFNKRIGCCEPIPNDNYGCPENYYFNANYQRCLPVDDNNCYFATTYNGYGECEQDPDQPGPDDQTEDDCPPGLLVTGADLCDQPEDGYDENTPAPGTLVRSGDQQDDGQVTPNGDEGQCPEGYAYFANVGNCLQRDDNGCPQGYYYDEKLQRCRPTNGPGSPCPQGFVYSPRLNCCVPQPGTDGTRCPEDEPSDGQTGQPNVTPGTVVGAVFDGSNYDPLTGLCLDGQPGGEDGQTGGQDGEQDGEENPCPPGTYATANFNCDQYPEDSDGQVPDETEEDPEEIKKRQADCPPEFWNANTNTCDYPEPQCGELEYFDRVLGYCVPLRDDCCEVGYDYSANYKECMPVGTKPRNGECPEGYELIDDLCWLIGRTEGQGGQCWTFTVNTPNCIGPCEVGLTYNANTGRCEEPQQPSDPCANVDCSRYKPPCPACCKEAAAGGGCVRK